MTSYSTAFRSLAVLEEAHFRLLDQYQAVEKDPVVAGQIKDFLVAIGKTGIFLAERNDRLAAQRMLDFWSSVLYQLGDRPPRLGLDAWDPKQIEPLQDSDFPYSEAEAFHDSPGQPPIGWTLLLNKCLAKLNEGRRLVAIIGPPRSGRSFLLETGLIPVLKQGKIPGSDQWHYAPAFTPPKSALKYLDDLVKQLPAGTTSVVVIDNFGQLFLHCTEPGVFIEKLLTLLPRHIVLLTLRSDFRSYLDNPKWTDFRQRIEAGEVRVQFDTSELRHFIEQPAARKGLKYADDRLVDQIIRDVQGDPEALQLLLFSLKRLWKHREADAITWKSYHEAGAGRIALSKAADDLYRSFAPEEKETVRAIFLKLVRMKSHRDLEVGSAKLESLSPSCGPQARVQKLVGLFEQEGLIRVSADSAKDKKVHLAQGALVGCWPELEKWIQEERLRTQATHYRQKLAAALGVIIVLVGLLIVMLLLGLELSKVNGELSAALTREKGDTKLANRDIEGALAEYKLIGEPKTPDLKVRIADAYRRRADLLDWSIAPEKIEKEENYRECAKLLDDVAKLLDDVLKSSPGNKSAIRDTLELLSSYGRFAESLLRSNANEASDRQLEECRKIIDKLPPKDPQTEEAKKTLASILVGLGNQWRWKLTPTPAPTPTSGSSDPKISKAAAPTLGASDQEAFKKALAFFDDAIKLDPSNTDAVESRVYLRNADYAKSLEEISVAIRLNPKKASLYALRGRTYVKTADFSKAVSDFKEAITLYSKDPSYYIDRGNVYLDGLQEYDKAIEDYTLALKINPNYHYALTIRGDAWRNKVLSAAADPIITKGMPLEWAHHALDDYSAALRINPGDVFALNGRSVMYNRLGEFKKAIDDCTLALRTDPNFYYALNNRGDVWRDMGDFAEALKDYSAAMRINPEDVYAYDGRAGTYATKGEFKDAKLQFEKNRAKFPNNVLTQCNLAILRLRLGEAEAYRTDCEAMLLNFGRTEDPDTATIIAWTGALAPGAVKEPDKLVQLAELAVKKLPNTYDFTCNLGAALYRVDKFDAAIAQLELAIKLKGVGGEPEDWLFLAMAHKRLKKDAKASEWLEKAIAFHEAEKAKPRDRAARTLPWRRRVELDVLRCEAEALIGATAKKAPAKKEGK